MSWVWIVAALWVTLAFGIAAGWALRGSIQAPQPDPLADLEAQQTLASTNITWTWPTDPPMRATGVAVTRPKPSGPTLVALVDPYIRPHTLRVVSSSIGDPA